MAAGQDREVQLYNSYICDLTVIMTSERATREYWCDSNQYTYVVLAQIVVIDQDIALLCDDWDQY